MYFIFQNKNKADIFYLLKLRPKLSVKYDDS